MFWFDRKQNDKIKYLGNITQENHLQNKNNLSPFLESQDILPQKKYNLS